MTSNEQRADTCLIDAKAEVRRAFHFVDPSPTDPLATELLKVFDSIDEARKKLKDRLNP